MKIYYLSATGNSLVTARRLARELDEDVTLESFRSIRLLPEIETEDTAVGFIFPVYFADVPQEFLACIRKMKFRQNTYLFAIATCNGVPGTTLRTLSGALEQKGVHLSAAFSLDMPGNALITPQAASDKRLNEFPGRLSQIARMIAHREQTSFPGTPVWEALRSAAVRAIGPRFVVNPRKFHTVETACVGCGLCARVCPASNIIISNNRPRWDSTSAAYSRTVPDTITPKYPPLTSADICRSYSPAAHHAGLRHPRGLPRWIVHLCSPSRRIVHPYDPPCRIAHPLGLPHRIVHPCGPSRRIAHPLGLPHRIVHPCGPSTPVPGLYDPFYICSKIYFLFPSETILVSLFHIFNKQTPLSPPLFLSTFYRPPA